MTGITLEMAYISADGEIGFSGSSKDIMWYTFGESDPITAETYVYNNVPNAYASLPIRTIGHKQLTDSVYQWTVNYGTSAAQVNAESPALTFQVGGGTIHITNSIGTPASYFDSTIIPSAMNFSGAIGCEFNADKTQARVRGVDVYAPILEYSLTMQFSNDIVTDSFISGIYALSLTPVNNAPFFNRPAGSVLFKGCRGSKKGPYIWEITFDFAYSPNVTGLTVGNITGIAKTGWQYMDVIHLAPTRSTSGWPLLKPAQVFIHTVYNQGDFTVLGIGTS